MSSSVVLFLCSKFPSIRVISNESVLCIRCPKYCESFQWIFSIGFLWIHWFDFLDIQGTLKSLLQYHSSKTSVLQPSAFFTVQLSHPYVTTGKTIALTRLFFEGKVMSLLFNMLSGLFITFLLKSTCLLISWLRSTDWKTKQQKTEIYVN